MTPKAALEAAVLRRSFCDDGSDLPRVGSQKRLRGLRGLRSNRRIAGFLGEFVDGMG